MRRAQGAERVEAGQGLLCLDEIAGWSLSHLLSIWIFKHMAVIVLIST